MAVFSADSRPEVRIGGAIETARGEIAVSGQIDRLVVSDGTVEFAEFKSGADADAATAEGERLQLALYGALLARIHPEHTLSGMLVRTRTGEVEIFDEAAMRGQLAMITVP
jgi:ATP-dependent helicase/nuclease subunit A